MKRLAFALLLISSSVLAQTPPPDPAFLQRALTALQTQRNQALDAAAIAQAQLAQAQEQITKLQAEIDELKKKTDAK